MYEDYVRARDEKGFKDADVSRITGIPSSTFSDWKKGKSIPKQEKINRIAYALGCPADMLNRSHEDPLYDVSVMKYEDEKLVNLTKAYPILRDMLLAGGKLMRTDERAVEAMVYALKMMAGEL